MKSLRAILPLFIAAMLCLGMTCAPSKNVVTKEQKDLNAKRDAEKKATERVTTNQLAQTEAAAGKVHGTGLVLETIKTNLPPSEWLPRLTLAQDWNRDASLLLPSVSLETDRLYRDLVRDLFAENTSVRSNAMAREFKLKDELVELQREMKRLKDAEEKASLALVEAQAAAEARAAKDAGDAEQWRAYQRAEWWKKAWSFIGPMGAIAGAFFLGPIFPRIMGQVTSMFPKAGAAISGVVPVRVLDGVVSGTAGFRNALKDFAAQNSALPPEQRKKLSPEQVLTMLGVEMSRAQNSTDADGIIAARRDKLGVDAPEKSGAAKLLVEQFG